MHVLFASYGNDSIALIRWAFLNKVPNVTVVYSDTGWASDAWRRRVDQMEAWAEAHGFATARTSSIGMEALVRMKKAWPRNQIQFCTTHLKILPAVAWLEQNDPKLSTIRKWASTLKMKVSELVKELLDE